MKKDEKMSEVQKQKQSISMKGKTPWNKGKKTGQLSDTHKEKISKSNKGKKVSDVTALKISDAKKGKPSHNKGKPMSDAQKKKISKSNKGRISPNKGKHLSDIHKEKISKSNKGKHLHNEGKPISEKAKRKSSATKQGIPYDEWESFACEKKYCPKFDEACREANRAKYNHRCFMCDKKQADNKTKTGKVRKLSVHHVDMDKAQGCESNWKLVPLCMKCHPVTHNDEMIARLGYIIMEV